MTTPVTYRRDNQIGLICIENPPVNAIGAAVRKGLIEAIDAFAADTGGRTAVLYGAGRNFVAGADIREFGKPPVQPFLPDVVSALEGLSKPVLCVIHGATLGGGLELALGAHYRLGLSGLKLGLPETSLGILPGAGGTQRLPRLIGAEAALEIITSARTVDAQHALEMGILDALDDSTDPRAAGQAMAMRLIAQGAETRRVCDLPPPHIDTDKIDALRERIARKYAGQIAQLTAIDAVCEGAALPFRDALHLERKLFLRLIESPQRAAMIHAFFAERQVAQLPDLDGVAPRAHHRIGVIGGGRMGVGIAVAALLAGLHVTLIERDTESATQAKLSLGQVLGESVQRGKLTEDRRAGLLADQFHAASDYTALGDCDVVIEAVFEDMSVKCEVFKALDQHCKAGAVLATNTSYLDISKIAAATNRPKDVLGLHFFSPAHVMRLLEIVVPDETSADVVATAFALGKRLGKISVRAGVCDGFIGNRILQVYRAAADLVVLAGASPYQVDRAIKGFGLPMGPYALQDLAGLDIGYMTRQRKAATRDPREFVPAWGDKMYARGWLGRKTKQGFYNYRDDPKGVPCDQVAAIIAQERVAHDITPRSFGDDEIVARYMAAMVNESAKTVGEGIAARPLDVDVTLLHGYGFPRWRGGPLHWADQQGLDKILHQIESFAAEDAFFWQPAPLLRELVRKGADFASLNEA